jgi:threonine dehydratase
LQDRPGALFKVMKLFDEKQVNIIEIYHQRIFTTLPAKGLITDIECEARDREHLDSLVASLARCGVYGDDGGARIDVTSPSPEGKA